MWGENESESRRSNNTDNGRTISSFQQETEPAPFTFWTWNADTDSTNGIVQLIDGIYQMVCVVTGEFCRHDIFTESYIMFASQTRTLPCYMS